MININLTNQHTVESEVNCLVIPAFEDTLHEIAESKLIQKTDKTSLSILIEKGSIDGKSNFYFPAPLSSYESILILGLGKKAETSSVKYREAAGKAASVLQQMKITKLLLEAEQTEGILDCDSFVEAIILGQYKYDEFKNIEKDERPVNVKDIYIHFSSKVDLTVEETKLNQAKIKCESANWARDLANKPGNALTPSILAEQAMAMAAQTNTEAYVLDEAQMQNLDMNSLLAVSAGSKEEAKMIVIKHTHPKAEKTIAIIGKGLTFDAGGLSLKPGKGMEEMKFDMCGAAAALGAMRNICLFKPAINVICVIPSSENLPSSSAVKPGDIVKSMSGKTIEIFNTDAEGRLILCDALNYTVTKYNPDQMVDLATLTGACIVALGHHYAGLMTEDDDLAAALTAAGEEVHERLWRLSLNDEMRQMIEGKDADLTNLGPPYAGTVTAGAFLSNFVGETKWAHLDIAGTAWGMKGASYLDEKLGSGFGVRLLTEWIINSCN